MTQHGRSQPFVQRLAKPADERSTCISTLCRLSLAGRGSAWCFALFAYALHKQPSQAQQGDGGGFRGRFLNTNGAKGVSLQDLRSLSPEYVFTFFHSRRSDVAIPATRVLRTTLHRFSALAVPPRFSPPAHILALPVRSAVPVPAPSSRTWDSLLPSVFAVRCRLQRSDPPLPFGRTLAVGVRRCSTGERCSAARWGARRRAVRNAPRDADAVRRWGSGVAVRLCLDVPMRTQRAARPCPIGLWRRVAGSGRTLRCWGCSRQRGGPPPSVGGSGASLRVYVHRTLAPRSTPGSCPCARYDAGILTNATRGRVVRCDLGLVEPRPRAAPPVTPR